METNLLMFIQLMDNQAFNNTVPHLQTQVSKYNQSQSNHMDYLLTTLQIPMETNLLMFTQLNQVSNTIPQLQT